MLEKILFLRKTTWNFFTLDNEISTATQQVIYNNQQLDPRGQRGTVTLVKCNIDCQRDSPQIDIFIRLTAEKRCIQKNESTPFPEVGIAAGCNHHLRTDEPLSPYLGLSSLIQEHINITNKTDYMNATETTVSSPQSRPPLTSKCYDLISLTMRDPPKLAARLQKMLRGHPNYSTLKSKGSGCDNPQNLWKPPKFTVEIWNTLRDSWTTLQGLP